MVGFRLGGFLLAFAALAAHPLVATAQQGEAPLAGPRGGKAPGGGRGVSLPPRMIVRTDDASLGRQIAAMIGGKHHDFPRLKVSVLTLPPGQTMESQLQRVRGMRGVIYAEPDLVAHVFQKGGSKPKPSPKSTPTPAPTATPTASPTAAPTAAPTPAPTPTPAPVGVNDPHFGLQWGLTTVKASEAWGYGKSASSTRIAILDTGVDPAHPDLAAKIVAAQNFTDSATVDDMHGHGTHVAGIAAAATNNGMGIAGAGFNASLMNAKVLSDSGSGYYSWIANGVVWAADNGAKVINLSLGGPGGDTTLQNAINYAASRGVTIVAAAGNEATSNPSYPAAYPACLSVASTTNTDAKSSFSNYGSWVSVAAPGSSIYSTLPTHSNAMGALNYGSLSGTSMATPLVAGIAAVVATIPSTKTVRSRIELTSDAISGTGTYWKYGRVNFFKAVSAP